MGSVCDYISLYTCVKISNNKEFKKFRKGISEESLNFLKKTVKPRSRCPQLGPSFPSYHLVIQYLNHWEICRERYPIPVVSTSTHMYPSTHMLVYTHTHAHTHTLHLSCIIRITSFSKIYVTSISHRKQSVTGKGTMSNQGVELNRNWPVDLF